MTERRVALFDVCQTLVSVTTIVDFTEHFLLSRSKNPHFSFRAWCVHVGYKLLRRFGLVTHDQYRAHFFRLYTGQRTTNLAQLAERYSEHLHARLKKPTIDLLHDFQQKGMDIYLVSAGLAPYLTTFAESLGATLIATELEVGPDGTYTGALNGIDCIGEGKVHKVRTTVRDWNAVDAGQSVAIADSASDIGILSLVGTAIVVDPDAELRAYAEVHGWRIIETRSQ